MLALLIDLVAAWLVARFVPPDWKQPLAALLGGWLAAIADSVAMALAFGWPPAAILSRLTVGLLVHPLIVGGLAWLFAKFRSRGKGPAGAA